MTGELEAAINYVNNCKVIYPELDLMDDDVRHIYNHCLEIIKYYREKEKQKIQSENKIKPKKIGKLKQFENTVLECLHQGFGEEKQLLEEAENRQNKWARINYINAYKKAVERFQRGE